MLVFALILFVQQTTCQDAKENFEKNNNATSPQFAFAAPLTDLGPRDLDPFGFLVDPVDASLPVETTTELPALEPPTTLPSLPTPFPSVDQVNVGVQEQVKNVSNDLKQATDLLLMNNFQDPLMVNADTGGAMEAPPTDDQLGIPIGINNEVASLPLDPTQTDVNNVIDLPIDTSGSVPPSSVLPQLPTGNTGTLPSIDFNQGMPIVNDFGNTGSPNALNGGTLQNIGDPTDLFGNINIPIDIPMFSDNPSPFDNPTPVVNDLGVTDPGLSSNTLDSTITSDIFRNQASDPIISGQSPLSSNSNDPINPATGFQTNSLLNAVGTMNSVLTDSSTVSGLGFIPQNNGGLQPGVNVGSGINMMSFSPVFSRSRSSVIVDNLPPTSNTIPSSFLQMSSNVVGIQPQNQRNQLFGNNGFPGVPLSGNNIFPDRGVPQNNGFQNTLASGNSGIQNGLASRNNIFRDSSILGSNGIQTGTGSTNDLFPGSFSSGINRFQGSIVPDNNVSPVIIQGLGGNVRPLGSNGSPAVNGIAPNTQRNDLEIRRPPPLGPRPGFSTQSSGILRPEPRQGGVNTAVGRRFIDSFDQRASLQPIRTGSHQPIGAGGPSGRRNGLSNSISQGRTNVGNNIIPRMIPFGSSTSRIGNPPRFPTFTSNRNIFMNGNIRRGNGPSNDISIPRSRSFSRTSVGGVTSRIMPMSNNEFDTIFSNRINGRLNNPFSRSIPPRLPGINRRPLQRPVNPSSSLPRRPLTVSRTDRMSVSVDTSPSLRGNENGRRVRIRDPFELLTRQISLARDFWNSQFMERTNLISNQNTRQIQPRRRFRLPGVSGTNRRRAWNFRNDLLIPLRRFRSSVTNFISPTILLSDVTGRTANRERIQPVAKTAAANKIQKRTNIDGLSKNMSNTPVNNDKTLRTSG